MKKLMLMIMTALGFTALAETKTWTGGATGDWKEASNWTPEGVPATTDDVVIDGNVEVTWNSGDWSPNATVTVSGGARLVQTHNGWQNFGANAHLVLDGGSYDAGQSTNFRLNKGKITIKNGGSLTYIGALGRETGSVIELLGGSMPSTFTGSYTLYAEDTYAAGDFTVENELQPTPDTVLAGANWTCAKFVPQTAGSVVTAQAGNLTFTKDDGDHGFYQVGTTHLDFPTDSTATLTIVATRENIYERTFGTSKYTYAGERITKDQFESLFEVTVNGDFTTVALVKISENAAEFGDVTLAVGETDDSVSVQASFVKAGTPSARVYLVWGAADQGRHLSDWGENVRELGSASEESPLQNTATGLPVRQSVVCRLIAVSDGAETASDPNALYMRQYGAEGTVNEFLGTVDASLSTAGNWSLGHVPGADEVRWFETGTVAVSGDFVSRTTDVFKGGAFTIGGEFKPADGALFEGTDFTFTIFSTPDGQKFTLAAGRFTATSSNHGGYYSGAGYGTFPNGSTAVLTFPIARSAIAPTVAKFRHNGLAISDFDDPDVWTVEEAGEGETATTSFSLTPAAAGAPVLGAVSAAVSAEVETTVTIAALIEEVGGEQPSAFTVAYGFAADALTESAEFAYETLTDGARVTKVLEGLEPRRKYFYQVTVSNSAGSSASEVGTFVTYNLPAGHVAWIGGVSAKASEAKNWSTGAVPGADADVEIVDSLAQSATLEWDVAGTVKSWTQQSYAGGVVTVVFETTLAAPLTIAGDVHLGEGANWTHKGPGTKDAETSYALNIVVGGDFTVDAGAYVQAGRGRENDNRYATRGYYNFGPGYANLEADDSEHRIATGRGASFGGDGGYRSEAFADGVAFVSYGSIMNPLSHGSSGCGNNAGFAGAGIVKLDVSGRLTLNGKIESVGFGWPSLADGNSVGASSGGSINIQAGALVGSGEINADGGSDQEGGNGSGGRVRVKLTTAEASFDAFEGSIHAYGGTKRSGATVPQVEGVIDAAAGTVVRQLAFDPVNGGTVTIANLTGRLNPAGATHLPAMEGGDTKLSKAVVVVTEGTKVRLTRRLVVKSLVVGETPVRNGVYTAAALNAATGTDQFSGEGVLVVGTQGLLLSFR